MFIICSDASGSASYSTFLVISELFLRAKGQPTILYKLKQKYTANHSNSSWKLS